MHNEKETSPALSTGAEITGPPPTDNSEEALLEKMSGGRRRKYGRFVLAALSSIPWIGGVISAIASFSAENDQEGINELQKVWMQGHEQKMRELADTLTDIFSRLDSFGEDIQERIDLRQKSF